MAKLVFKTTPRPYQVPALKKVVKHGGGGLYVPMRWGKSWVAINWAAALHLKNHVNRLLIVCPNDVKEVWEDEFEKHCPVPYRLIDRPTRDRMGELRGKKFNGLEVHIRNFEAIWAREQDNMLFDDATRGWSAISDQNLLAWKPQLMIVDEAHHIGNPTTLTSKKVCQAARLTQHRLFLTGTPWHRKPYYIFGQFKFYDPSVFGEHFGHFKKHITIFGGFGGYEVKRYRNLRWTRDKIKPHVFYQKYVPTTPPVIKHYKFGLSNKTLYRYHQMEKESILELGEHEITAEIALTRYLRLAQITGGWIKTPEGKYIRVGKDKKQALIRRVYEYNEQEVNKIVVGCRFIPELLDVRDAFRDAGYDTFLVHGGVAKPDRVARRKAFAAAEKAAFITQFRPSREGIDLSSADTMVYYSLPEDFLTYDQFKRRIEKYDEKRTLLYEHLIGRGTVEELAYKALARQQDVVTYMMENPDLVEQLTAVGASDFD
jgi:superfamily II DNA or RNA helicase